MTTITISTEQAQINTLKAAIQAAKEANKTAVWEAKYSHVIAGTTRRSGEISSHKGSHGKVCQIRCEMCQKERTINVQDAFQVRYCLECAVVAKAGAGQIKRAAKAAAKMTPEVIKAQMAELEAMLAALTPAVVAA